VCTLTSSVHRAVRCERIAHARATPTPARGDALGEVPRTSNGHTRIAASIFTRAYSRVLTDMQFDASSSTGGSAITAWWPYASENALTAEENSDPALVSIHRGVSIGILALSTLIMLPVYLQYTRRWRTYHPIIQSAVALILPDCFLVLSFLPVEIAILLAADGRVDQTFCRLSAFASVVSIVSSNAGVMLLSYMTYATIVNGQKLLPRRMLYCVQLMGWMAGIILGQNAC
jgi:hypothetical protein